MTLQFRNATLQDARQISDIENACFPKAEAATFKAIQERIEAYGKGFFIAEIDNNIIGFINGGATDDQEIKDEFFESMDLHHDDGKNLVIFGLDVHPDYQGHGYSRLLMNKFIDFSKEESKKLIILTCKDHLIKFYSSFGYENLGVSDSSHGGAVWYDMILNVKKGS